MVTCFQGDEELDVEIDLGFGNKEDIWDPECVIGTLRMKALWGWVQESKR